MSAMSMNVWESAAEIVLRHLATAPKLDAQLEDLPRQWTAADHRRCRHLVYGVIRHRSLLGHVLDGLLHGTTRPKLRAALLVAAFELLEHPENAPAIVHHAVARTRSWLSAGQAGVANAVLRRVPPALQAITDASAADDTQLALRFSHPEWLVARWLDRWGLEKTRSLLEWNQQAAVVHARVFEGTPLPAGFLATDWPGFFRLDRPERPEVERLLAAGAIYLQDPATAVAPDLVAAKPGETVLDLCAAPGGKTLQLASRVRPDGQVVAVDLPGARFQRLSENLERYPNLPVRSFACDVAQLTPELLAGADRPTAYDAVLIDVPCSNTGVLRHRVDAKWRLRPDDLVALPRLQLALLRRAAALVRPGGRLVYSTCSLEPEENDDVVRQFFAVEGPEFVLEQAVTSLPWESSRDGAGAFLLRRNADDAATQIPS